LQLAALAASVYVGFLTVLLTLGRRLATLRRMTDLQLRVDLARQHAIDLLDQASLETELDDWRCVMKECARRGPEGIARMAERRCDQLLAEVRTRNEQPTEPPF
jgi:hypothetical protein